MRTWAVVGVLLLAPLAARAQSVRESPVFPGITSVVVWDNIMVFNLTNMNPGPIFRDWWAEVEGCASVEKPFDEIVWYVADGLIDTEGRRYAGVYNTSTPEIILVRYMNDASLQTFTKHEILHHLGFHHGSELYERCV